MPSKWYGGSRVVQEFKRVDRPCCAVVVEHECTACRQRRFYVRVDLTSGSQYPIKHTYSWGEQLLWDTPWAVPKYAVALAWKAIKLKEFLEEQDRMAQDFRDEIEQANAISRGVG